MLVQSENHIEEFTANAAEERKELRFDLFVADENGRETYLWSGHACYEGSISRSAIYKCEEAVLPIQHALDAAGISEAYKRVNVTMSVDDGDPEPVWPAFSQVSHLITRFAESPHKYLRPPKIITLQFIRGMMRAHTAFLARKAAAAAVEAADAECQLADAELHVLEVAAGMHEPSYYD